MPRKPENLDNKRFNSLVVETITSTYNNYGRLLYKCRCDCGTIVYATASNLKRNEIKRCQECQRKLRVRDLTDKRFGRLTAIRPVNQLTEKHKHGSWKWLCQCDCGKQTITSSSDLINGKVVSCGCVQKEAVKKLYYDGTALCKLHESEHPRVNNTSGVTGVWYNKSKNKWCAEIMFKRKKYYLGSYDDKDDAISARIRAEKNIFQPYLDAHENNIF